MALVAISRMNSHNFSRNMRFLTKRRIFCNASQKKKKKELLEKERPLHTTKEVRDAQTMDEKRTPWKELLSDLTEGLLDGDIPEQVGEHLWSTRRHVKWARIKELDTIDGRGGGMAPVKFREKAEMASCLSKCWSFAHGKWSRDYESNAKSRIGEKEQIWGIVTCVFLDMPDPEKHHM